MKKKFDTKAFDGRQRVEKTLPNAAKITRLYVWDALRGSYQPTSFIARRWKDLGKGCKTSERQSFESLEQARAWQSKIDQPVDDLEAGPVKAGSIEVEKKGLSFGELVEAFKLRHFPKLARGSQVNYVQQLELHFQELMPMQIEDITPRFIDDWLETLKRNMSLRPRTKRMTFEKELSLLATILRFYDEYYDCPSFKLPIKNRHRSDAVVVRRAAKPERTLSFEDFLKAREASLSSKYGELLYVMMTIQFRQALRIGEVAALHWEDVTMDFKEPSNSGIRVRRHLDWTRKRNMTSKVVDGLKNSRAAGLCKELPMFPETFEALKRIYVVGGKGLVFKNNSGTFFEYRSLQHGYEQAFKIAGIPFGGTHNFRHGGVQLLYNQSGGNQALAGQLLGNEDSETIRNYARLSKTALKDAAKKEWLEKAVNS